MLASKLMGRVTRNDSQVTFPISLAHAASLTVTPAALAH